MFVGSFLAAPLWLAVSRLKCIGKRNAWLSYVIAQNGTNLFLLACGPGSYYLYVGVGFLNGLGAGGTLLMEARPLIVTMTT